MEEQIINEDSVLLDIENHLRDCDADELARIYETIMGGKCYFSNGVYNYTPESVE